MKHLTQDLTASMRSTPEQKPERDLTRPDKVWSQLAELFGKAFYREHGEEPSSLWQQAVWSLNDAQIINGLANLGNDNLSFPANVSQFVSACKRTPLVRQLGVKLLPMSQTDKEISDEKAWADMEKLVGHKLDRGDAKNANK